MSQNLESIVLIKPKVYKRIGTNATKEMIRAEQSVLSSIKEGIIDVGTAQLKAKSGYDNEHLPEESPKRTPEFALDRITFGLVTDVQVINPLYQTVFDQITGFLEDTTEDWMESIQKYRIRTYEDAITGQKGPFIRWDYLMERVLKRTSRQTKLGATNEVETINPPKELAEMDLSRLVIPIDLVRNFDINKPGAAKIWYLANRFYNEVQSETIKPVKKEMERRTGVKKEEMPNETKKYWEQFVNILYKVESVPSPRKLYGKIIDLIFAIPQKDKPEGGTALPVVPNHNNYIALLEEYGLILPKSLEQWKFMKGKMKGEYNYEGKIGEAIVFYYGLENDSRVQQQFSYLPEYQLKRDGDKMFLSVQALYDRMKALEENYVVNRLHRKHSVVPIV